MREARQRLTYEVVRRHDRGDSIRSIARALRIDRKTVRRILDDNAKRRSEGLNTVAGRRPRAPRPSKLDPHLAFITKLVADFPDIRATRVLEELQQRGFDGSYTIVREHLKRVRPKPAKRRYEIVETAPGKQCQVDWSTYKLVDGTPFYALSCILSYSRYQYIELCTNMRQPTLFRALRRSFDYHGGIAEEYVFDSMPTIVDRWEAGRPVLNLRAIDFAAFYHFGYHIAPRNDPRYKGKVERVFRAFDEGVMNGRRLHTVAEARHVNAWWLEHRCNARNHPKTRRPRREMLAEEHLKPLPAHSYDDREIAHRLVDGYGYVRFDDNFYRAPDEHIGAWVYVCPVPRYLPSKTGSCPA